MGALASDPLIVRMAATGALRRMEPRVASIEVILTTFETEALASGALEAAVLALDFVEHADDGLRLTPDLPLRLTVMAEDPAAFLEAQAAHTASPAHRAALADRPVLSEDEGFGEEAAYRARGLAPLPPELRGSACLEPAPAELLCMADIAGAFGLYAPPRGRNAVALVVDRARREGYAWAVLVVGSDDLAALEATREEAETARQSALALEEPALTAFVAVEAGLAASGEVAVDPAVAAAADLVVLRPGPSAAQTAAALSDPRVKVLGPPADQGPWTFGEADWEIVIRSAADHAVALASSGSAAMPPLPDLAHRLAQQHGVAVLPAADAVDVGGIDDLLCAVGGLRRMRWTREPVLATRDALAFEAWLKAPAR